MDQLEEDILDAYISIDEIKKRLKSKRQMREFFREQCKEYNPPKRDFTAEWTRQVWRGEKRQLKLKDVQWIDEFPKDCKINGKTLYKAAKEDEQLSLYLPDYAPSQQPEKAFLINVINTLYPGKLRQMIIEVKKKLKEKKDKEKLNFVQMKTEYFKMFEKFESVYDSIDKTEKNFIGKIRERRVLKDQRRKKMAKLSYDIKFS